MKKNYKFFRNEKCEYFPCHRVNSDEKFNCLFCYCPLNPLKNCGGNFRVMESGIKDCSNCLIPHSENGYEYIMSKMPEVLKIFSQQK